jgi:hypothetical protein
VSSARGCWALRLGTLVLVVRSWSPSTAKGWSTNGSSPPLDEDGLLYAAMSCASKLSSVWEALLVSAIFGFVGNPATRRKRKEERKKKEREGEAKKEQGTENDG